MSRDWLAVYSALLARPKYRRLGPATRGALLHVWLLATTMSPEARWPDRQELEDTLELDGFARTAIAELVEHGWLDPTPDGGIEVHDWDVHQYASSKAIRDAFEAQRKREWRRRKSPSLALSPTTEQNRTEQNKSPDTSGRRPDGALTHHERDLLEKASLTKGRTNGHGPTPITSGDLNAGLEAFKALRATL